MANLYIYGSLYGFFAVNILNNKYMNKVTKRIRISVKTDDFLNRFKLQKQRYIETALIEKIQRDYPIEFRNTFLR